MREEGKPFPLAVEADGRRLGLSRRRHGGSGPPLRENVRFGADRFRPMPRIGQRGGAAASASRPSTKAERPVRRLRLSRSAARIAWSARKDSSRSSLTMT